MENLTKKQQGFVKDYVETGNGTQAVLNHYEIQGKNPEKIASALAVENLGKPSIQEAIKSIADHFEVSDIAAIHKDLLKSTRLDHMIFPLGPKDGHDANFSGGNPTASEGGLEKQGIKVERTTLTDEEIKDLLQSVNCQVRRIVHGDTARHVYFWAPDNMARDKALDKVYKLKGAYANEGSTINIGKIEAILVKFIDGKDNRDTNRIPKAV